MTVADYNRTRETITTGAREFNKAVAATLSLFTYAETRQLVIYVNAAHAIANAWMTVEICRKNIGCALFLLPDYDSDIFTLDMDTLREARNALNAKIVIRNWKGDRDKKYMQLSEKVKTYDIVDKALAIDLRERMVKMYGTINSDRYRNYSSCTGCWQILERTVANFNTAIQTIRDYMAKPTDDDYIEIYDDTYAIFHYLFTPILKDEHEKWLADSVAPALRMDKSREKAASLLEEFIKMTGNKYTADDIILNGQPSPDAIGRLLYNDRRTLTYTQKEALFKWILLDEYVKKRYPDNSGKPVKVKKDENYRRIDIIVIMECLANMAVQIEPLKNIGAQRLLEGTDSTEQEEESVPGFNDEIIMSQIEKHVKELFRQPVQGDLSQNRRAFIIYKVLTELNIYDIKAGTAAFFNWMTKKIGYNKKTKDFNDVDKACKEKPTYKWDHKLLTYPEKSNTYVYYAKSVRETFAMQIGEILYIHDKFCKNGRSMHVMKR